MVASAGVATAEATLVSCAAGALPKGQWQQKHWQQHGVVFQMLMHCWGSSGLWATLVMGGVMTVGQ